jgi:hypothetical protein
MERKDELLSFPLFKTERVDEKRGLNDARRGTRKKVKHATKETKLKNKLKSCKEVFITDNFFSF